MYDVRPLNEDEHEPSSDISYDRRALLRRGGAVLAGVAALGALNTEDASAAPNDPVLLGTVNDAANTVTTVTSSAGTASVVLRNTASGAAANVAPTAPGFDLNTFVGSTETGDLVNHGGSLLFTHDGSLDADGVGEVYTDIWASQLVPITPKRMLDTRSVSGRANVLNPSGAFDSAGRLIAGKTITLDLSDLVFSGVAVYANLTIVTPLKPGYATLWPSGTRPVTSSINFAAGQIIANFAVCGLSDADSVRIYTSQTTHVLLDVTGFAVGASWQVNPAVLPASVTAAPTLGTTSTRERPSWAQR